jgi:NADPH-dependent ferric siderophore reductase
VHGEVIETQRLSPTMVRVVLGGNGLDGYTPAPHTDQYVNALFIPDGAPYQAPFDPEAAKATAAEHRPRGRRFTIRRWDPAARTIAIDFVVHGDVGYAGCWAARAKAGDLLQLTGPSGAYTPDPTAGWHLLVGDESALPAIAASLEQVRPGVATVVVVVVDDAASEVPLESPGDLRVHWVHRSIAPADPQLVADAVAAIPFPHGRADVFVHGEAAEVRAVRRHLVGERGIDVAGASISPYWRRGETDEAWRSHKREWLAEVQAEV